MDCNISFIFSHLNATVAASIFNYCLVFSVITLIIYLYKNATSPSGIHYVNHKRCCLQMNSHYNPFSFEANYSTASFSGIKCVLKSHKSCYVQALWGVPMYQLFQLLHKDWKDLKKAVTTYIPAEKFSSKCICANDPFLLEAGEEKTIEFRPHWNAEDLSQEACYLRDVFPLVVIMVLNNSDDIKESFAIAMASAVHIPDKNLNLYSQLIGQYLKLDSGHVGQVKKIFLSSPVTSNDGGDTYDLCLACYHRPVSMVFLPCCHACLCSVCFELCKSCPVCRASSSHYFELPESQRNCDR